MAVTWSRTHQGVRYEVRRAGRTLRLYSNGVFHSSYNPAKPVTGGVWDMLMLPALCYPPGSIRRVLLLGVGGGTVIRQLREFVRPRQIVGVDLNEIHLDVAQRFFGVAGQDVTLVRADARDWLDTDRDHYDLVIDDLFGEREGQPVRGVTADANWCRQLARRAGNNGAVAINCIGPAELARSGFLVDEQLRNRFHGRLQLRAARDANAVGAFLPFPVTPAALRKNLLAVPGLNPGREPRLKFSARSLP